MKPEIIHKISKIIRAKSDRSYTHLFFTGGKQIIIAHPLNHIEGLLLQRSKKFIRVNRTHLIHLRFIDHVTSGCNYIVMKDGTQIPIPTNKKTYILYKIFKKEFSIRKINFIDEK